MTLGVFARASQRVLDHLGEDSLLRGAPAGKINIEHNANLSPGDPGRSDDNHVARFTVATIDIAFNPNVGDEVAHPDGAFLLDRLLSDNGYLRRFIAVKA